MKHTAGTQEANKFCLNWLRLRPDKCHTVTFEEGFQTTAPFLWNACWGQESEEQFPYLIYTLYKGDPSHRPERPGHLLDGHTARTHSHGTCWGLQELTAGQDRLQPRTELTHTHTANPTSCTLPRNHSASFLGKSNPPGSKCRAQRLWSSSFWQGSDQNSAREVTKIWLRCYERVLWHHTVTLKAKT